ncbi:glycosyltransferase [Caldibacillus lycopersici]|uniref:Glycosyltransferase n=1 Tax=Perspicuibacillus lycopersici TaxID=1325689 RepID=A0AAE3IQ17_9BACI|nr:glycosyltransferase [Perspicuibacillus lycopersici]MCU9612322.1 glycosyltransferase [Perspicuibacillus lycopersici]
MLISVIIPVYNVEKYLKNCVESILNQTYKNLEIILVDDGSTDSSGEICDFYQQIDKRVKVIHRHNGGVSNARNTGISVMKGDLVTFVDSDDYIDPRMVEILYRLLLKNNADISATSSKNVYEKNFLSNKKQEEIYIGTGVEILMELHNRYSWEVWGKLYKRELFSNIKFLEDKIYEDYYFSTRIFLSAKKAVFADYGLYNYYQRSSGIMGESSKVMKKDLIEIIESNIQFIDELYKFQDKDNQKLYANFIKHSFERLYRILLNGKKRRNFEYIQSYRMLVIKNITRIMKNEYIEVSTKFGFLLSLLSVSVLRLLIITKYSFMNKNSFIKLK